MYRKFVSSNKSKRHNNTPAKATHVYNCSICFNGFCRSFYNLLFSWDNTVANMTMFSVVLFNVLSLLPTLFISPALCVSASKSLSDCIAARYPRLSSVQALFIPSASPEPKSMRELGREACSDKLRIFSPSPWTRSTKLCKQQPPLT